MASRHPCILEAELGTNAIIIHEVEHFKACFDMALYKGEQALAPGFYSFMLDLRKGDDISLSLVLPSCWVSGQLQVTWWT